MRYLHRVSGSPGWQGAQPHTLVPSTPPELPCWELSQSVAHTTPAVPLGLLWNPALALRASLWESQSCPLAWCRTRPFLHLCKSPSNAHFPLHLPLTTGPCLAPAMVPHRQSMSVSHSPGPFFWPLCILLVLVNDFFLLTRTIFFYEPGPIYEIGPNSKVQP